MSSVTASSIPADGASVPCASVPCASAATSVLHPLLFWCHDCDMSVSLVPSPSPLSCPQCASADCLVPLDSHLPPSIPSLPPISLFRPRSSPDDPDDFDFAPLSASASSIAAIPTVDIAESFAACAICKDDLIPGCSARRLPCSHLYHSGCIVPWLSLRNSCPLCRSPIPGSRSPRKRGLRVRVFVPDDDDDELDASLRQILEATSMAAMTATDISPVQMDQEETVTEWAMGDMEEASVMSDFWEDAFN
ncbi:E3 ubiquitin-protein ligase RING1 [Apostasia shenzhenica]|uniref:RING-type E3 ubiquitin transferase n=1 Tax=Apostasia shenzhenica TaxID=1088818 RepID=A0A2H9ZUR4_9ASPA|nr:E3 ubiquitin-protein ligase RING1 [Apostasia shenzhenica]